MAKLRIHNFAVSIDGYGAGPSQSIANPLGGVARHYTDGPDVSENAREEGGSTGVDDDYMQRGFANIGAWILGRNLFGMARRYLEGLVG